MFSIIEHGKIWKEIQGWANISASSFANDMIEKVAKYKDILHKVNATPS